MALKLIIAGIGGQGVVYATKVLSHAALARGERVMASENHGMSQRGGSVLAHVKIGGGGGPPLRRGAAGARAGRRPGGGGGVVGNGATGLAPAVMAPLADLNVGVFAFDADACAKELGTPAVTNLVVL